MYQQGGFLADTLADHCMPRLIREYRIELVCESAFSASLKEMAKGGLGIAWLPEAMITEELKAGTLVSLERIPGRQKTVVAPFPTLQGSLKLLGHIAFWTRPRRSLRRQPQPRRPAHDSAFPQSVVGITAFAAAGGRSICLAPTAGTAMTEGLLPEPVFKLLAPESVSPAIVFLSGPEAPSRKVLCAGGGSVAVFKGFETAGLSLLPDDLTPEGIADVWDQINDEQGMRELQAGFEQPAKIAMQAAEKLGLDLDG